MVHHFTPLCCASCEGSRYPKSGSRYWSPRLTTRLVRGLRHIPYGEGLRNSNSFLPPLKVYFFRKFLYVIPLNSSFVLTATLKLLMLLFAKILSSIRVYIWFLQAHVTNFTINKYDLLTYLLICCQRRGYLISHKRDLTPIVQLFDFTPYSAVIRLKKWENDKSARNERLILSLIKQF